MKKGYIVLLLILTIPLVYAVPYSVDSSGNCATGKNGVKIGSLCYDCGESDGICPEYASSGVCSTTIDSDCCQVTGIKWLDSSGSEITSASNGQSVTLELTAGTGCAGQTVSFDIWEVEPALYGGDDDYSPDPSATTIDSTGKASILWNADGSYSDGLGQGGPEYVFYAQVGGAISYGPSSELAVEEGAATTQTQQGGCGDGILDVGEDPTTCPADAGCDKGQVYCDNDAVPACKSVCDSTPTDCTTQAKCLQGLICSSGVCACNPTKDGVFPPQNTACFLEDPDLDFDSDSIIADNCPLVSNINQEDADSDGDPSICDYSPAGIGSSSYVSSSLFSCGGDSCDSDDDNDAICDEGITSPDCSGSDRCPNTPQTVDISLVDSDGCTEEQKSCLTQWDCSQASWSACDETTNTVTRDTSLCTFTGAPESDCEKFYQPESVKSCLIEAEFPVFSLMNIILTLSLISTFYFFRK